MRVKVYKEDCVGCGVCADTLPEIFKMDKEYFKAKIIKKIVDDELFEKLKSLIEKCPEDAIELLEK